VPGTSNISTAKRVSYALGYLELGLHTQAADELAAVVEDERASIPVRLAWVELHLSAGAWEPLVAVAQEVARADPAQERAWIGWAYGQRRLTSLAEARMVLIEAVAHHGTKSALLHYNLGCYECQLGNRAMARVRLRRAFKLGGGQMKTLALNDPDLEPMRDEIEAMP
jgi:Tfp pilus assembly protein PilF